MIIENMYSNICQWMWSWVAGMLISFMVAWWIGVKEIQKPENVEGGMYRSLTIRNGYSLALINQEEIFLIFKINCWFSVLLEILKAFQCLYILLQRVKLCTAMIHVHFFLRFFFRWCILVQFCAVQECWQGSLTRTPGFDGTSHLFSQLKLFFVMNLWTATVDQN